ncbi:guanitoxin biosynthesis L-enduracididine beta-hydroxylase GntD [Sulfidibacter corallicola]|uniref:TauD/TfdA family dioxygenase n=1 Tax=Sulfidibacter corallicola TaxID=2818388 RepID=A0A8A4TKP0_SULCO|nr:guanitoxin biosynthesis L-enduracididine beta-hydroxylase GntD [Sulfidibacter corallicola]QTD50143.1 TauD/TfdA family dioxygenase [Sulfidibacter corallicola]
MYRIDLEPHEVRQVEELIDGVMLRYKSVEDPDFLDEVNVIAHELPRRLRHTLHRFKHFEDCYGTCVVGGLPVDDGQIGPTPQHWRYRPEVSPTLREEIFFVLCSSILGDAIAWSTQQDGYLMHEVAPIKEHETDQLGFSSQQYLEWHTEDAFHPYRADYLGLMCFRNPTGTSTTVGSVTDLDLEDPKFDHLFDSHFTIKPDESHLEKNRALHKVTLAATAQPNGNPDYDEINLMNERPDTIAVLFGDRKSPYMRLDPYFMGEVASDSAREALDELIEQIESNLKEFVLKPGEIFFADNYRVVHGRTPFKAKYDGRDRWLKRLNIVRDLRKSRDKRARPNCRKIS